MRRKLCFMMVTLVAMLVFSACSSEKESNYSTSETSQKKESSEKNNQTKKGEEVQDLKQKMEDFCQAYFHGDSEAVKGFLSDSFSWDVEVYEKPEEVDEIDIRDTKGLTDVSELIDSEEYVLSKPFIIPGEDSFTYLTVSFLNENGEWKISSYGLEK